MLMLHLNQQVRFRWLLQWCLALAFVVQTIIITYNHFSGFYVNHSFQEFIVRLVFGTIVSTLFGLVIIYFNLLVINNLNRYLSWSDSFLRRIFLQLIVSVSLSFVVAVIMTGIVHQIGPYKAGLWPTIWLNSLILAVVNLLVNAALEAWIYYSQNRKSQQELDIMRNELALIKFEVLKNQLNPHFLFNSLNVLSALISNDVQKAAMFVEEFAQIYRYVLETIEKPLVSLEQELSFARSYMYLQQIRYGTNLHYVVDVDSIWLKDSIPPLSLQVVLENAIKHNSITNQFPLFISLKAYDECLWVENTLRQRVSGIPSTGIGQKNLARRYELVCGKEPIFKVLNEKYLVKLPLIKPD